MDNHYVRIQRRPRIPLPSGTLFVGRGSAWANPFDVSRFNDLIEPRLAHELYGDMVRGLWTPSKLAGLTDDEYREVYLARRDWLSNHHGHPTEVVRGYLKGHDLACWCPLISVPCHADILLAVANR